MERFAVAVAGERESEMIVAVEVPGIAGFAGEQRELTDTTSASSGLMIFSRSRR